MRVKCICLKKCFSLAQACGIILLIALCGFLPAQTAAEEPVAFLSVTRLAQECGLSVFLDDLSNRVSLQGEDTEVIVTPGLDVASFNSEIIKLASRARFFRGEVEVPQTFAETVARRVEKMRRERLKKKKAGVPGRRLSRVVLDPGHGGKFPGAVAHGLQEKEINLWLALRVRDILREQGLEVLMTRSTDRDLSYDLSTDLDMRCEFANSKRADIFLSIHANASVDTSATGFEAYVVRPAEDIEKRVAKAMKKYSIDTDKLSAEKADDPALEKILWRALLQEYHTQGRSLAKKICSSLEAKIDDNNRGVLEAGFRVIKWTWCPAVLVEVGFMSNRHTARKLKRKSYRKAIAEAIAEGILKFKEEFDRTAGFSKVAVEDGGNPAGTQAEAARAASGTDGHKD